LENNIIQEIDLEEARHGIRKVSNFDSRNTTQNMMFNSDLTNTTTHTQMDMSEYSSTSKQYYHRQKPSMQGLMESTD
jgi:hypothetical protein